jgi:O-acetyl-ADP-ribose deacetylase (regulator of RNase III)
LKLTLVQGDILAERVEAIVVSANPWLNLSGGVGGALLLAGGQHVQRELHDFLQKAGKAWLPAGSIVCTGPGPLAENGCRLLVHAVAIDALYQTDQETLRKTLASALQAAAERGLRTIAVPALATGYGPLSIREFCLAALPILQADWPGLEECLLVLKDAEGLHDAAAVLG